MSLEIINAGFLSLLQDYGRYGLQKKGISTGGPLDEHAYLWANYLLNNHYNAPQLEISFGGFAARFTQNTMIALCGADLSATLNGQPLNVWQTHFVNAGDEIKLTSPQSGLRTYLAVHKGFDIKPHLSSCATVMRDKLGGLRQVGAKIQDKDCVPFTPSKEELSHQVPRQFIPSYQKEIQLRFIPNTSATGCHPDTLHDFIDQAFKVTPNIDRMGYRLEGEAIIPAESDMHSSAGIISQGISVGAIQLPKDGQPIVLLKDRQTMGGYPQLGCVVHLDLSLLAQSAPGTTVSFSPVSIADVEAELMMYKCFFRLDF